MELCQFSRVRVMTNRFKKNGIVKGAIGYIIEAYPDGEYEVEVSDKTGTTIGLVVAKDSDLELADPVNS